MSEADFVTVQSIRAPRETVPGRTYLLAGLLHCGVCRRRMESSWTHGRAAYRCRHGHSSTTRPEPGRSPNAYVREDHLLPHLPALVIRLAAGQGEDPVPATAGGDPATPVEAVEYLRGRQVSLIFDPADRTLTADTPRGERIAIG